jgi:16S rRNA (cytosine967-C5)-methyltransferase
MNARQVAVEALVRIEDGAFAHILVPEQLRKTKLSPRDRALVTDLVYGTVRLQRALDHLLTPVASRPLAKLDPPIRAALRMGAYQLFSGMPAHAAVGETVSTVPPRARGFVNGSLRGLTRAGPPWSLPSGDDTRSIGIRLSHPDWIVDTLVDAFGRNDAMATLTIDNEPPLVTLRINRARTTPDVVAKELSDAGVEVQAGTLIDDALVLRRTGDIARLAPVRDGRATPQDQSSQAVVAALDPQPGERILDVAAAPGGKATAIAERLRDDGVVIAADLHPGRVRTIARIGAPLLRPIVADGRALPARPATFDRVLLDAPCSGLGVLRRRPDARWRVLPGDVADLAALQQELIVAAAHAVKPGGRLVYSVCTVTPAETLAIDAWAEQQLPEFSAVARLPRPWRTHGRGAIALPSDARTDGMFVLVLDRVAKS